MGNAAGLSLHRTVLGSIAGFRRERALAVGVGHFTRTLCSFLDDLMAASYEATARYDRHLRPRVTFEGHVRNSHSSTSGAAQSEEVGDALARHIETRRHCNWRQARSSECRSGPVPELESGIGLLLECAGILPPGAAASRCLRPRLMMPDKPAMGALGATRPFRLVHLRQCCAANNGCIAWATGQNNVLAAWVHKVGALEAAIQRSCRCAQRAVRHYATAWK